MIESKRTNIDPQKTNYNTMTEGRRTNIDLQSTNYNTMTESRRTNIDLQLYSIFILIRKVKAIICNECL